MTTAHQTDTVPAAFVEHTRAIDGRTVRYADAGRGPVIVAVHGGNGWRQNLSPALADLATDHRVVAPELPGFGDSPAEGISSMREIAAVITTLVRDLGIDTYSVLGTSVGSIAALWIAVDNPERVEKLVLEAPGAFREGAPPAPGPPPGRQAPSPEQMAYLMRVIGPATDPDLVAAMPGCEVPTLVLFGQVDPLFPPMFAPEYKRLPASNLAIVYAAGHDIKGDRPEAFLATVRDYLDRGPAFVVNRSSTLIHP